MNSEYKSGFIGIMGAPNVGKSTLMNAIIGEKISIITAKSQTTRHRITGILTTEKEQLIFVDTPGIHRATTPLSKHMVSIALAACADIDLILLVIEADRTTDDNFDYILTTLSATQKPVILVINKIDLITQEDVLVLTDALQHRHRFAAIVPVSALKCFNLASLHKVICEYLPAGPAYFPGDMMTDLSERFLAAERIREKIFLYTHREIPYSTAVFVDVFSEDAVKKLLRIHATIVVEKSSQKGIIIGKGGSMLKRIGTAARADMEQFFGTHIDLQLFVKVRRDWTKNDEPIDQPCSGTSDS